MTTEIPHLTTALRGPLLALEETFFLHQQQIEAWFRQQWQKTQPPIYSSVDIRNAGFKVAPVDTNLFPAGFNNLNPEFFPLAIQAVQSTLAQYYPHCQRLLIIPEAHTRNVFYLKSLLTLQTILVQAGYDVQIGSLDPALTQPTTIPLENNAELTLHPIQRDNDKLCLASGFTPCLILLNNDLSGALPDMLNGISQAIVPPLHLGWFHRLKSQHFQHYDAICHEFAERVNIDPWLLQPAFSQCAAVDFQTRTGEDCLIEKVDELVSSIQEKYTTHHVNATPFVVVKADAGTYGMGILMVQNGEQIRSLNRKQRQQMMKTKGHTKITKVIIQEGIPSFETWGDANAVAEPVVYLIGSHVIGGFYRVHTKRGPQENLNAPGMHFEPLAFAQACNVTQTNGDDIEPQNRFYAYGVIARLAVLAAARERADARKKEHMA